MIGIGPDSYLPFGGPGINGFIQQIESTHSQKTNARRTWGQFIFHLEAADDGAAISSLTNAFWVGHIRKPGWDQLVFLVSINRSQHGVYTLNFANPPNYPEKTYFPGVPEKELLAFLAYLSTDRSALPMLADWLEEQGYDWAQVAAIRKTAFSGE